MAGEDTATAVGATFSDKASAERCVAELRAAGFETPWMAVVTDEGGVSEHAVAETNDGALGALGRYFTGHHLLRPFLIERGVGERAATSLDESVAPGGAVVVVRAPGSAAEAQEILRRGAARTSGEEARAPPYPSTTDTIAGQGDELDRGSGTGA